MLRVRNKRRRLSWDMVGYEMGMGECIIRFS